MTSLSSFVKKYLNELHDLPTKVELVDDGLKLFTCLDEKAIEVSGAKLHRDYSPNFYCYRLFQQADHRMLRSDVLKLKDSLPQPSYLEVQIDNYQDYAQIRDLNLDRICLVSMKEEDMSLILQEKIANTALCYRGNVEITKIRSLAKKGFDVIEIENGIENSKPVDLRFKVYKDAWNK
jgi:nicotinate-nucleotide pyrophosphorylase